MFARGGAENQRKQWYPVPPVAEPNDARALPVATPCISVCRLDPFEDRCVGCYRTIEEIAEWRNLSQEQRRAIMAELPARRAKAAPRAR
jgi:hypothetical protein